MLRADPAQFREFTVPICFSETINIDEEPFSVMLQSEVIESKRVGESVKTCTFILRPRSLPTVCDRAKPASNPCASAKSSAARTERVTLLHFEVDQLKKLQLPLSSTSKITYPSWEERSLLVANDASAKNVDFRGVNIDVAIAQPEVVSF